MRYGQIQVYGGQQPVRPWPNTQTNSIVEKEDYQLTVKKTWIGNQWQIIVKRTIGAEEYNLELYLSGDELEKLKESL